MRHPLLVPDLRELIKDGEIAGLRDFFAEHHPGRVAELIEDLETAEADVLFRILPPRDRAEVLELPGQGPPGPPRQGDASQGRGRIAPPDVTRRTRRPGQPARRRRRRPGPAASGPGRARGHPPTGELRARHRRRGHDYRLCHPAAAHHRPRGPGPAAPRGPRPRDDLLLLRRRPQASADRIRLAQEADPVAPLGGDRRHHAARRHLRPRRRRPGSRRPPDRQVRPARHPDCRRDQTCSSASSPTTTRWTSSARSRPKTCSPSAAYRATPTPTRNPTGRDASSSRCAGASAGFCFCFWPAP